MNKVLVVFRRELRSYFATPLAYVFIVIFLVLAGVFTFQVGGFLERNQADLQSFFRWHPWLYLVLIPANTQAARNLPTTACHSVMGKVMSNSMLPLLRSSAQSRMEIAGISTK